MGLLKRHDVAAIADVRSKPSSRRNPQFNRDDLQETLGKRGIAYRVNEGAPPCRDFKRYS